VNVPLDSTVTFVNHDSTDHTATADDGSFDTGPIPPGGSATIAANQPGDIPFHCSIHPKMKGILHVAPAASPSSEPSAEPSAQPSTQPSPQPSPSTG
jgi:hypothetical protein